MRLNHVKGLHPRVLDSTTRIMLKSRCCPTCDFMRCAFAKPAWRSMVILVCCDVPEARSHWTKLPCNSFTHASGCKILRPVHLAPCKAQGAVLRVCQHRLASVPTQADKLSKDAEALRSGISAGLVKPTAAQALNISLVVSSVNARRAAAPCILLRPLCGRGLGIPAAVPALSPLPVPSALPEAPLNLTARAAHDQHSTFGACSQMTPTG